MRRDWGSIFFQFRVLYRVFLLRVIDLEILSKDGDPSKLMGQFGTVFVIISFALSLPALLIVAGSHPLPMDSLWMLEHFFLETSMTVAGLITVLSWDASFPDRRDVLVLAPLPVRSSILFLAKISALFAGPALAMISLNLFSGLIWPLVFAIGKGFIVAMLRTILAYWITIFLGGAFFIFGTLAVQGLAENLLPRQIFLRLSALLQAAMLCLLLSVYFIEPSFHTPQAFAARENQRLLEWLPSYWFLGLFNQLNGSMHPVLEPLARRAWMGLALTLSGAAAALLLSYYRVLPKIVEQPEILPGSRSARSLRLGSSVRSAVALFSLRTLLRSRQHRMILSFYLGLGVAIVIGFSRSMLAGKTFGEIHPGASMDTIVLFASILMMILSVLALRVVVSIPIMLRANWIFRATQIRKASQYQSAIRLSWLVLAVMPVLAMLACISIPILSSGKALAHLVIMALLGATLVELCLSTFRKIPFTCSYLPGKGNLHFVFWVGFFFVARWLRKVAAFEDRLLGNHFGFFLAIFGMCVVLAALQWIGRYRSRQGLIFEEEEQAEIISLKLS